MPGLKTRKTKGSLLRRVRKQRLKTITILPSLITILNGICGFAAIVFAGKGKEVFAMAGYMVLLAMIADVLDGRLARISKSTSSFGGQLDSLCDIISFGVAPAFLILKVLEYKLGLAEVNGLFGNFLQRFIWLVAAAYLSCAAIRLARFNVENEEDESAHMSFVGLPSPAAAGVIVSLVIFHQETLPKLFAEGSRFYLICENAVIYTLPFWALAIAMLMVSRVRYSHIINQYMKGKKPLAYLIICMFAIGLIIGFRQIALVLGFCTFAASGFVKWFYYRLIRKKKALPSQPEPVTNNI
ncbi:MAG: CDP-diacylglycerol--serine O-phosphatidyltransferase [Planctomycetota bacterium]|jgi:CDP-diacylglycerol--serine O-phosphatidyltransferase